MSQVVLTVATGKPKYGRMGMALGRSLELIEDPTYRVVITDLDDFPWSKYFHKVIRPPRKRSALDKLLGLELTDADQILTLDCDSLVFKRLAPIFAHCSGLPFAVQGFPQSKGEWHGVEVEQICQRFGKPSVPRFNGGLIYYERSPETLKFIEHAQNIEANYDSTGFGHFRGNASEEVCVLLSMLELDFGAVIDDETDFMSTGVGLIGKPEIDILRGRCQFVCRRERVRLIQPTIFHAARFVNFMIYWRQIRALERLMP